MNTLLKEELIQAGFIVKPYGFNGEVIIGAEITAAEDFPETDFIFLLIDGLPVPFKVEDSYLKNGQLIFKLEDVSSEAEAKRLNGVSLFIAADDYVPADEDVSFEQLKGFKVIDSLYGELGCIEGIDEYPMQLIARCIYNGHEVLFPLNDSIVDRIDAKRRIVKVTLPEGLIDVYSNREE